MTYHSLEELYRGKEMILDQVQRTVRSFSIVQLSFRPASGVWSIAEIVEHLAISETGMIRLIGSLAEKAESAGGTAPAHFEVTLGDGIVDGSTGKYKTRPEAVPTGNVPAIESLNALRSIQAEFLGLRPRLANRVADTVEDRDALDFFPALARRDPGHDPGAVFQHPFGLGPADLPGDSLNENPSGLIEQDAHGQLRVQTTTDD